MDEIGSKRNLHEEQAVGPEVKKTKNEEPKNLENKVQIRNNAVDIQSLLTEFQMMEVAKAMTCYNRAGTLFRPPGFTMAYLWAAEEYAIKLQDNDEFEALFLSEKKEQTFQSKNFYGWHDYGGYWGLFKPTLQEVINLIYDWWLLTKPVKFFVTTRCFPSMDVNACFCPKRDKHCGETIVWWPKSN